MVFQEAAEVFFHVEPRSIGIWEYAEFELVALVEISIEVVLEPKAYTGGKLSSVVCWCRLR